MHWGIWFYVVSGLWGLAVVANLMQAARLSQLVEERSEALRNRSGLPRFARIFEIALNKGVAQDEETQALRADMNRRLLIIVGGFIAFYVLLKLTSPAA